MADTPPVAGPLPVWYTAACMTKQPDTELFLTEDVFDSMAAPSVAMVAAGLHHADWVARVRNGTIVYPTPNGGPGVGA